MAATLHAAAFMRRERYLELRGNAIPVFSVSKCFVNRGLMGAMPTLAVGMGSDAKSAIPSLKGLIESNAERARPATEASPPHLDGEQGLALIYHESCFFVNESLKMRI
jgi:hypothetical protein